MAPPPTDDDRLEDLIARAVQELEQRGEQGLQVFLARHASHADAVRTGLEQLRRAGILAPPTTGLVERSQFGEFKVLRRIGAGGMGVVYAAEQTSLQRTVALKVVRPEFLLSPTARERFRREVDAIARLQHPGIVPILAVGSDDAQPWYAMEYVDGHSLEELVASMRGKDPARADGSALRSQFGEAGSRAGGASAMFAGSYWEACVRIALQVATAMVYVHERGIVHRDLKPSNVVLTAQGQALVLDFGLAHVRDLQRLTRDDRPVGSPAYAAPEQLRGEAVDERVDIYGLGVTLYELLTTHLPFERPAMASLQKAILDGGARPVRTWNRAVPRDLEIVCAVAIDRDRARRYRSMADFVADLEAVLARRPVQARPLGWGMRALRFARRHPTWSIAAAALLLVGLQFPLVLWRQQASANAELAQVNATLAATNRDLERTNAELDRQRTSAIANYNDAIDAVKQVVGAAQGEIVTVPGGERYQLAILRRADEMFEQLRKKPATDYRVDFESARNLQHIGTLLGRLGDQPGSEAHARRALERTGTWNGANFDYLRGSIRRNLGLALTRRGAVADAELAYEQARCELELAMRRFPGDRIVRRQYGEALADLGNLRCRHDRAAGLALLREAQQTKDALVAEDPNDLAGALTCALGHSQLADELARNDLEAAAQEATRGIDVLARFVPLGEEEATLRSSLAGLYDSRGASLERLRRHQEAEHDHGIALALRASLAHDFPATAQYRYLVACSFNNLAMARNELGDPNGAIDLYADAVERFRQATRMSQKRVDYASGLVTTLQNLAQLLQVQRRWDELAVRIDELVAVATDPQSSLLAARLTVKLAAAIRGRGEPDAEARVEQLHRRAAQYVATAIDRGFTDRAHFETSAWRREYDAIRDEPAFLDAMDRLPTAR